MLAQLLCRRLFQQSPQVSVSDLLVRWHRPIYTQGLAYALTL